MEHEGLEVRRLSQTKRAVRPEVRMNLKQHLRHPLPWPESDMGGERIFRRGKKMSNNSTMHAIQDQIMLVQPPLAIKERCNSLRMGYGLMDLMWSRATCKNDTKLRKASERLADSHLSLRNHMQRERMAHLVCLNEIAQGQATIYRLFTVAFLAPRHSSQIILFGETVELNPIASFLFCNLS
nr:hypothetical protein Iba_chr03dCG5280 [Ipomoea batatas]